MGALLRSRLKLSMLPHFLDTGRPALFPCLVTFHILFQNAISCFFVSSQSSFQTSTMRSCFLYFIDCNTCSVALSTQLVGTGIFFPPKLIWERRNFPWNSPLKQRFWLHWCWSACYIRLHSAARELGESYTVEQLEANQTKKAHFPTMQLLASVITTRMAQVGPSRDLVEYRYTIKYNNRNMVLFLWCHSPVTLNLSPAPLSFPFPSLPALLSSPGWPWVVFLFWFYLFSRDLQLWLLWHT